MRHHRDDPVYLITDAATSRAEDRRRRQRSYLVKMGIRTLCLVLAVVLYAVHAAPAPVLVVLLAAAVLLPWASVVAANAPSQRPGRRVPPAAPPARPQLGGGPTDGPPGAGTAAPPHAGNGRSGGTAGGRVDDRPGSPDGAPAGGSGGGLPGEAGGG